jgi:hypothetical protein
MVGDTKGMIVKRAKNVRCEDRTRDLRIATTEWKSYCRYETDALPTEPTRQTMLF